MVGGAAVEGVDRSSADSSDDCSVGGGSPGVQVAVGGEEGERVGGVGGGGGGGGGAGAGGWSVVNYYSRIRALLVGGVR